MEQEQFKVAYVSIQVIPYQYVFTVGGSHTGLTGDSGFTRILFDYWSLNYHNEATNVYNLCIDACKLTDAREI